MRFAYWLGALALLSALLATSVLYSLSLRDKVRASEEATRTAQAALKADRRVYLLREKTRAARVASAASQTHILDTAIAAAPAWAETPVPQEVRDALAP